MTKDMQKKVTDKEKLALLALIILGNNHEINNLNNCIIFNISVLRDYLKALLSISDDYAEDHQSLQLLGMDYFEFRNDFLTLVDDLQQTSGQIYQIISNYKELSRGSLMGRRCWVDSKELIQNVVAICTGLVKGRVKSFHIDIEEDLPVIYTEPYVIQQVVINLLINATEASDKRNSCVTLNVKRGNADGQLIIEVKDNGRGMDEQIKKEIFEPFFSTKDSGYGNGLGLSLSKRLIESLDEYIEVESEPGKGSTFRIKLGYGNSESSEKIAAKKL